MKETKHFPVRPSAGWSRRVSKWRVWNNLYFNVILTILAGLSALIIMFWRENVLGSTGMTQILHGMMFATEEFVWPRQWNYTYHFEPNVSDWDQQRGMWTEEDRELWPEEGPRPRVMMVSGLSPHPCEPSFLSHLLLRSAKNKLDYSRMHDMELYYNMGKPDPDFSDGWVKLPVIRMLMLQHPEMEWIWWLDADAIVTDMSFEPPFAELEHHNLVLYGDDHLVYHLRDWTSVSTSNFMIRNCQWSLDLLDAWGSMGTDKMREESGKFESEVLANRPLDLPGDDQSSLVALLAEDHRNPLALQKWVPSVKLVTEAEYVMNGNWTIVGPDFEWLTPGKSERVPFVTHFTGCLPACTGGPDQLSSDLLDVCTEQLEHAFDFADNQVYRQYGFQPRTLGRSLEPLLKIPSEAVETDEGKEDAKEDNQFSLPPKLTDWDEKRRVWMDEHPSTKREEVLLVSGSAPKPCESKAGGLVLLRAFKNRIDYARMNGGSKVFYNMAVIDKDLTGWWSKLPLIKMLMLSNPNVEWIWWMDSDAAFTDMDFKLPFSRYDSRGYNLVMYGSEHEVFGKKSYTGINTGNVLFRNCQWTLDLLDRWASFGATEELRVKNEDLLNNFLSDRPSGWSADDQCVLVYVLISEREKWESQVCLETSFAMSGAWEFWITQFEDGVELEIDPFVTHFAGCHPCAEAAKKSCLVGMTRTYNFADNQVLERYGLRHDNLNSSELRRFRDLQVEDHAHGIEDFEAEEVLEIPLKGVVHTAKADKAETSTEEELAENNDDSLGTGHTESDRTSNKGKSETTSQEDELDAVSKEEVLDKALDEEAF